VAIATEFSQLSLGYVSGRSGGEKTHLGDRSAKCEERARSLMAMSFNALIAVLALLALIGMIAVLRQLIQLALVLAENRQSPGGAQRRRGPSA